MRITGKGIASLLLAAALTAAVSPAALAAPRVTVTPQKVYVNGVQHDFEAYAIDGYNYFRLRDLAYLLNGTKSQFSVDWDKENNAIVTATGEPYAAVGNEMRAGQDHSSTAVPSTQKMTVNGEEIKLSPYNIGWSNFFKLRDLGAALGFNVEYVQKGNTVQISSTDYTPEESAPAQTQTSVTVSFIDVGQGDSIFIDDGAYEVLIDAGTADKGALVSSYIKPYVDGDLDLVIATHAHADHVGGLTQVINDYQVDEIIDSGDTATSKSWQNYRSAAAAEPNCKFIPDSDMTISMSQGVSIQIIEALDGDKNLNNDSVCALLTAGKVKALFTGDNEEAAEAVLAKKVGDVDVFKAAHHGSSTANTMTLLSVIKPEYAVVSCGLGNTYGHPHLQALENFAAAGVTVYGTEKSGTIVMKTDGTTYSFNTAAALTAADAGNKAA